MSSTRARWAPNRSASCTVGGEVDLADTGREPPRRRRPALFGVDHHDVVGLDVAGGQRVRDVALHPAPATPSGI